MDVGLLRVPGTPNWQPKSVGATAPKGERRSCVCTLNVGLLLRGSPVGLLTVGLVIGSFGDLNPLLGKSGLRRPWGLRSLRPTGLRLPCVPSDMDSCPLFFRRLDARSVPWRESDVGVFWELLPGLLDSGTGMTGLFGVSGLRFFSPLPEVNEVFRVRLGALLGLRRSEGLRRVRKDCDLAFRILGSDWWW